MYTRIYSKKNNTIFKYYNIKVLPENEEEAIPITAANINCGANENMELMDGKGESKLLFGFEIPDEIKTKLTKFSFKANLQLWDAGTLFEPALPLKELILSYFNEDFSEGDGYSFLPPRQMPGVSNWIYRQDGLLWSDVQFNDIDFCYPDSFNEDLIFNISDSLNSFVENGISPKYCLRVASKELDLVVKTKYFYSNYTKTVFKPYIELFIEDTIIDKSFDCIAGEDNKIYLLNQTGKDFVGFLSASMNYDGGDNETITPVKQSDGVYYISINPSLSSKLATILWAIDSVNVKKQLIQIKSPNQLEQNVDTSNLFFYPTTPSSHNIIRTGDIVPFKVISQIRGKGDIINFNYEYKVTTADGFEMVPWTSINVYRNNMYFNLPTNYYFPEQQYEVWLRNKTDDFTITSNLTYKFKLAMNDKSHMKDLATSPYYSRDVYFGK